VRLELPVVNVRHGSRMRRYCGLERMEGQDKEDVGISLPGDC